nr:hypothetical protein [Pseudomonadota bacterium]
WNISPARIFLGDSGSHFVGFFLGVVTLYTEPIGEPNVGVFVAFVVSAMVFAPFLFWYWAAACSWRSCPVSPRDKTTARGFKHYMYDMMGG